VTLFRGYREFDLLLLYLWISCPQNTNTPTAPMTLTVMPTSNSTERPEAG